jgi:uncharacterized protein (TIGR02646 family)
MIKLELAPKPEQLTEEFQRDRTERFKSTGESVWNIPWLKDALLNMSHGKCCYSETRLGEESKYVEVEHFVPKSIAPELVLEWGNLLPSCKTCNGTKGDHDTRSEPIVNPFVDNPKDFFFYKDCILQPKENKREIAKRTTKITGLNLPHFTKPRLRIGNELGRTVGDLFRDMDQLSDEGTRQHYLGKLSRLMSGGVRTEPYSALISTLILADENYIAIEEFLRRNGLWNDELSELKTELEFCSLPE